MRPPEFTGGNLRRRGIESDQIVCFNEAAGIHRRKHLRRRLHDGAGRGASMRPPEFTGGNSRQAARPRTAAPLASMRPPEFTGGNLMNATIERSAVTVLQ